MTPPTIFERSPSPPIVKIPGHFGDIMSKRETTLTLPDGFTGLERIILTANGNLQRLISAYFNATVSVTILNNTQLPTTAASNNDPSTIAQFQREVNLICNNKIVCNAKSIVRIKDQEVYNLVVKKGVGIGQIFRYLDRLPSFELHGLGRTNNNKTFWREYSLGIPGVECRLLEVLPSAMFDENWINTEPEEISWNVELQQEDRLTWVNL
ncbi:hypothetical protein BGZ65_007851 [Modicella reniformis]|uniref:Uncharacterized protein n=1 Tax=Modicella reniformis TaxID=1440133 RepID=A0A9P6JGR7_9FUNG|nr:hypothetical protein BGZ65_007851 [Modicella reniformis]